MIQDIFPKKLDNQWSSRELPQSDSYVLCYEGRSVLVSTAIFPDGAKTYQLPRVSDIPVSELTYLFKIDSDCFFLGYAEAGGCLEYADITFLRENKLLTRPDLYAILTGKHLETWYSYTKFCGKCGSSMHHSEKERAMICEKCGNTVYPRIMPAVIVGVKKGDRLLLTRYNRGYQHNALIAGFVEIGETLEETVAREVMEEAGIKVKNITYYKSQPWGVASDILTGFYCEVDGDDTIRKDDNELKYAAWVERSEIVLQPDDASLTNEMMKMFKDGVQ